MGESKGRCCLIHFMGNPAHSSPQGAADAKILPEFREIREIHRLKIIKCNGCPAKSCPDCLPRSKGGCVGGCALLGHLPQPCTSPLGERHLSEVQLQSSKPLRWSPWCRFPKLCPIPMCSLAALSQQSGNPSVFPYKHITPITPCIPPASQPLPSQGTPE